MSRGSWEVSAIREILKKNPHGMTVTEIAAALSRNKHSVGRYLDTLRASGVVEMRSFGMAKVFSLSRRLPLSQALGSSSECIMILDSDQRVVQINERFLKILQLEREEVVGRQPEFLTIPDPSVQDMIVRLVETAGTSDSVGEHQLETGDGQYFSVKVFAIRFDDDSPGTVVAMIDITGQMHALKDIRDREEMFRGIAENIQDGLIVCEGEKILFANRKISHILGYSREEITSMRPLDFLVDEEKKKIMILLEEQRSNIEVPSVIRTRILRKNGEERFIESRITSMEYGGRIRRFILITDMEEWKQKYDTLSRQQAFMETLFDAYPRPMFITNPEGLVAGCNSAFVAVTGISRGSLIGTSLSESLGPALSRVLSIGDEQLSVEPGRARNRVTVPQQVGAPRDFTLEKASFVIGDSRKPWIFTILIDSESSPFPEEAQSEAL